METHEEQHQPQAQATESTSSQTATDSLKKKKVMDAEESLQTDCSDEVTEKTMSLQLQDTTRAPKGHQPRESTEVKQVSASKTGKEEEHGAVAEASATASGTEGKGEDEVHGSKKKKKKKKKKKTEDTEQRGKDLASGVKSTEAQRKADQKERILQPGYVLDRHARNRNLSKAAKFFLQSLDEESTESEPSLETRFQSINSGIPMQDIMQQLWLIFHGKGITILHGPDGCGKTLTALFIRNVLHHRSPDDVQWCRYSTLPEGINVDHTNHTVYIMDNFLGHTNFEGFPKWSPVYNILRKKIGANVHVLLVSRTSILQQAIATTGADFADLLNASSLVELSVNRQTMYRNMLPEAKDTPDFDANPDIGFPVCCKLASSLPDISFMQMFQHPRSFLHEFVKGLIENTAGLLSLGLLAVTEGYVNARDLRNPARLIKSIYLQVLQSIEAGDINEQKVTDIIDFYNETPGLVQVEDDFVSFTNEALREAVLCVLCETHAQFLAKHCSLRLLSRLALITQNPDQTRDDDGKPMLTPSATEHFLQRLLDEMRLRNYRDALPSALFEQSSFQRGFKAKVSEKSLINTWLGTNDKQGLHFLFWASACKPVTEMLIPLKARRSKQVIWQGVVGSCYWGNTNMLKELLSMLTQEEQKFVLSAKIEDFFEQVKDFNWEESPFQPEDTLLTLAAWRGNDDVVKKLVAMEADVECLGHNDLTALMHYCARGHVQMVRLLLRKGTFMHLQDDIGNTALHYALMGGLEYFHNDLFHDKTLRLQNDRLRTPLVVACGSGAARKILDKLRHGAHPDELYRSLLFACYKGQTDIVKYLFETENRKRPILHEKERRNAAQAVINTFSCGKPEQMLEILLPKVQRGTDSKELCGLCLALCAYKDDRAIKEYLPLVKASFEYDCALVIACMVGNKSVIEYLFESQSFETSKPLILQTVACMGSWDFMEWALAATKTPVTMEVVTYAMTFQQSELVKLLLTSCDVKTGDTPSFLHLAARHDLLPVLSWLLDDKLMNVDLENKDGVLPVSAAIEFGRERAVKCLVNYGAKITEDIKEDLCKHRETAFRNERLCKALERTVQFLVEGESNLQTY